MSGEEREAAEREGGEGGGEGGSKRGSHGYGRREEKKVEIERGEEIEIRNRRHVGTSIAPHGLTLTSPVVTCWSRKRARIKQNFVVEN